MLETGSTSLRNLLRACPEHKTKKKTENKRKRKSKAKPGSGDCKASTNESNQPAPHPAWSLKEPADKGEGVRIEVHFTANLLRACERQHNIQYKRGKKKKGQDRSKFLNASGWAADSFVHQSHHISVATSVSTFWCFWYWQERSRETAKQEIEMATDGIVNVYGEYRLSKAWQYRLRKCREVGWRICGIRSFYNDRKTRRREVKM